MLSVAQKRVSLQLGQSHAQMIELVICRVTGYCNVIREIPVSNVKALDPNDRNDSLDCLGSIAQTNGSATVLKQCTWGS